MAEKRFYWIKLKTDFFNQDAIDFLMGQDNGCEYIVLYQMLCLQTANNNGRMATEIGEIIAPFDVKKIVRDTKYFDADTVIVALELFTNLSQSLLGPLGVSDVLISTISPLFNLVKIVGVSTIVLS